MSTTNSDAEAIDRHQPMFRMPVLLGRASGPRNMPADYAHLAPVGDSLEITVRALTDAERLSRYLPRRCRLAGEPILSVAITQLTNLGWLAGRGYNVVNASMRVVFEGEEDQAEGQFNICLWESKADPILTGREELGMPKLFADIPDPREVDERWECQAAWEGFKFLELALDTSNGDEGAEVQGGYAARGTTLVHRYFPRTGQWDQADVDCMVASHPSDCPKPEAITQRTGVGEFHFDKARWQDMPTQYTFVNALAELPIIEFRGGQMTRTRGIGDLKAYRVIR